MRANCPEIPQERSSSKRAQRATRLRGVRSPRGCSRDRGERNRDSMKRNSIMWKRITFALVATAPLLAYACKPGDSDSDGSGGTDTAGGKAGAGGAVANGG